MIDNGSRPPGPGEFIAELNALYESCNRPPYRKLAEISEHLSELYGRRGLPVLSATAVFEVLAGRRKRLPSSAWVASFILCCQRRAWETGVLANDPGIAALPEWQARLRAAQTAPPQRVPAPRPADSSAPRSPAPEPGEASADSGHSPPEPGEAAAPLRLTASQRASVADYGEHGRELADRAAGGDAEAAYRIGVLLGTDSTRGPEAVALLIEAAAGGHPQALDLLDTAPDGLDPEQAAGHAYRLGEAAAGAGAPRIALAYYKAAVRGGRLDAAFKITEILRGGTDLADPPWFAPAGNARDTDAPGQDC